MMLSLDYEMQVAISEALCRMTPRKLREDFAGKWFRFRSFASAFTSVGDKYLETVCLGIYFSLLKVLESPSMFWF